MIEGKITDPYREAKWLVFTSKIFLLLVILWLILMVVIALVFPNGIIFSFLLFGTGATTGVFYLRYKTRKLSGILMEKFAKKHGFLFLSDIPETDFRHGLIFVRPEGTLKVSLIEPLRLGRDKNIYNYSEGIYKEHKIELYNYTHRIELGRYWYNIDYVIAGIKMPLVLPRAIIKNRDYKYVDYGSKFIEKENLVLESNEFNQKFEILLNKDNDSKDELKLLEILTPDVMERLIDTKIKYLFIEFEKHAIVVYKPKFARNEKELEGMLDLLIGLYESAK
jgi:hypothetical protein